MQVCKLPKKEKDVNQIFKFWLLYLKYLLCVLHSTNKTNLRKSYDTQVYPVHKNMQRGKSTPHPQKGCLEEDTKQYPMVKVQLCREVREPSPQKGCLGYDTKLHRMVRLQLRREVRASHHKKVCPGYDTKLTLMARLLLFTEVRPTHK